MITVMQGDQYSIPYTIRNKDTGELITDADAVVVSAVISNLHKSSKDGGFAYNADEGCWLMYLRQQETFALPTGTLHAQIRIKLADSDDVIGEYTEEFNVLKSADREVL